MPHCHIPFSPVQTCYMADEFNRDREKSANVEVLDLANPTCTRVEDEGVDKIYELKSELGQFLCSVL